MLWLLLYIGLFLGYMFGSFKTFTVIYDDSNSIDKTIIASMLWPIYWPFVFIFLIVYLYKQKKDRERREEKQAFRNLFTEEQLEQIRTRGY